LLAALITAGLWPRPVPVELHEVARGPLRATIDEEGKTRIRHRYVVSAPVTGQLRRIQLKAGDRVQAEQTVIAVLDPLPPLLLDARSRRLAEARCDTARAHLDKARSAHQLAASELRRYEQLHREGAVSSQELELIQWREVSATKEWAAAESALQQAEAELAEFQIHPAASGRTAPTPTEVKAPADGLVLRVFEEHARAVINGTPLIEVGDPSDLELVIEVLSRDAVAILPGAAVEVDQWGGGAPLLGRVRVIEPAAFTKVSALGVEEQRVNVIADLVTPHDQRPNLGDQFRVEARILVWETSTALKVASGALFRQGAGWAAYKIVNGRAHHQSIEIGRTSGTETQVLKGLVEGDAVILYPGDRVRPGQRIRAVSI
jgi:HlyD family secretion protein